MIEILLIKGSSIRKVATINYVLTDYAHCERIVEAIARTMFYDYVAINKIDDNEYPIAYRLQMDDKYKLVARDITK